MLRPSRVIPTSTACLEPGTMAALSDMRGQLLFCLGTDTDTDTGYDADTDPDPDSDTDPDSEQGQVQSTASVKSQERIRTKQPL